MANTINISALSNTLYFTVINYTLHSDGTDENNTVVYDDSVWNLTGNPAAFLTSLSIATSVHPSCTMFLNFLATQNMMATCLPCNWAGNMNFLFPVPNPEVAGYTGDIAIKTLGLQNGDSIHLILVVHHGSP